jgi:predicted Rossmann fold flavoprotein
MSQHFDVICVGGGAAGFFTAITIAEKNPKLKIAILERGKEVLTKVRISGGGRCNVTHACFEPNELVKSYPRGEKELKGPFNQFCTGDTIEWFEKHGVELKIEEDGRMFPITDSSQTIIDCFMNAASQSGIKVITGQSVQSIYEAEDFWKIDTQHDKFTATKLVLSTGSNPKMWEMIGGLGHTIIPPVPSLFTFNITDKRIKELPGVSALATVKVKNTKLEASGPLLITHWGMSGPAILKLSAWGAPILAEKKYQFAISVNWLNDIDMAEAENLLKSIKQENSKKIISKKSPFEFPNRLWEKLVAGAEIGEDAKWADLSNKSIHLLAEQLTEGTYQVSGKSTYKDEFVTAGGIDLKEINFKTMQSKLHPNLFFAGEIVNIDAVTGGFNFQNAWTSGFIVGNSIF